MKAEWRLPGAINTKTSNWIKYNYKENSIKNKYLSNQDKDLQVN